MYKKIIIVSNHESTELDTIQTHIKHHYKIDANIQGVENEILEENHPFTLFFLYLSDNDIKRFFALNMTKNINVAIVGNSYCPKAMKNYGIAKDIFEAIDDGMNSELLSKIDIVKCNEFISFSKISVGNMHGMNQSLEDNGIWHKIKHFFTNLQTLQFQKYTLTTAKEQKINTVASGITILDHTLKNEKHAISDNLSIHDGKLNAFVLAPSSLVSYMWYLISIFFYQKISIFELPKSLGFIKTSKLLIESDKEISFSIDGLELSSKTLDIEVIQDGINLHLGKKMVELIKEDVGIVDEKDSVKINSLPKGEINNLLLSGSIPFFKRAADEEFKELFISLKSSAITTPIFLTLMVLSTLLATTGLFANSTSVIIGAMILAPLMAPIISLSMGVVRADNFLFIHSIKTLFYGISLALLFSSLYTYLIPLDTITTEMQGRLHPSLLDLMVAVISGIAGAYANAKEEVAKSLAGVAIAVALVPPLSVTGIGIGLGSFDIVFGSFLLFITNLIGIALSAALTFVVLRYSPIKKAKKGLFYSFILMVLVAIPLWITFENMVLKSEYLEKFYQVKQVQNNNKIMQLQIEDIKIENEKIIVILDVISNETLEKSDLKKIKDILQSSSDKEIVLEITNKLLY